MSSKKQVDPDLLEPGEFVNLHGHSTYSVGDAIGSAKDITDSVIESGMDAVAITDHGNMNVVGDFYLYAKKIRNKHPGFKTIFGTEAYFHPDLDQWEKDCVAADERKAAAFAAGKTAAKDAAVSSGGENEVASKSFTKEPAKRRHHLVLLAQNSKGLENLFSLNAFAHSEGYGSYGRQWKMPRIDFRRLEEHAEGVVCTSACLAGPFNHEVMRGVEEGLSEERVLANMEAVAERFDTIFNQGDVPRFYLEIQFNTVDMTETGRMDQQELNRMLVLLHRKTGIPLIAAADYHYPQKEVWRARDLIKVTSQGNARLHDSIEELDCELFPKNAVEMIESYNEMDGGDYITQEELLDAIRNTGMIARELITKFDIDIAPKYPMMYFDPYQKLTSTVFEALKSLFNRRGWDLKHPKRREYIERVKMEMALIKKKKFAPYFVTDKIIIDALKKEMLVGCGRGCFVPGTRVLMADGLMSEISLINEGDTVIDAYGEPRDVCKTFQYAIKEKIIELEFANGLKIRCTEDHKFLTSNRGWVCAIDLLDSDNIVEV